MPNDPRALLAPLLAAQLTTDERRQIADQLRALADEQERLSDDVAWPEWEVDDWLYLSASGEIEATTTDEALEIMAREYEEAAVIEQVALKSDILDYLQDLRQRKRDEEES